MEGKSPFSHAALTAIVALACYAGAIFAPAYASADITHNLVGWWKFDEGTSTYAHDSSGIRNHNAFLSSTSTLPQWVSGKFGSALSFDGSHNFVNNNAFALDQGSTSIATSTFTIAMWFKLNNPVTVASPGHAMTLFSLSDQASSNDVYLTIGNRTDIGICTDAFICGDQWNGGAFREAASSQSSWAANTWYHVAYTFSTSSGMALYINGALSGTDPGGTGRGSIASQHSSIGGNSDYYVSGNSYYFFNGALDDVRVYTRALSASDIAQLVKETQSYIRKPANNLGMVAWWKFDEGTSTTAHDSSGNGSVGIFSGTTLPKWVSGKFGQGIYLDGITSYVNVDSVTQKLASGPFSVAFWFNSPIVMNVSNPANPETFYMLSDSIASKNDIVVQFNSGPINCEYLDSTSAYVTVGTSQTTWSPNTWYHIVYTYNPSASNLMTVYVNGVYSNSATKANGRGTTPAIHSNIGKPSDGTNFPTNATIDDFRLYNRTLSATEVANLYQAGAVSKIASAAEIAPGSSLYDSTLIAYYTFDGKDMRWTSASAGTAMDRSGNGNMGPVTNMTRTGSPTIGKIGQALNFNANSYILLPGNGFTAGNHPWTITAWVNPTAGGNYDGNGHIIAQYASTGGAGATPVLLLDSGGYPEITTWTVSDDCLGTTLSVPGKWIFLVGEDDGSSPTASNLYLYINGNLNTTCTGKGNSIVTTGGPPLIGDNGSVGSLQGKIDDVRFYNRMLTPGEIQKLYKLGQTTLRP